MFVVLQINGRRFILEHSYEPYVDKVAFMVRNLNTDRPDYFTISILDIENTSNMISYRSRANTF
jgi:hypothetical protein